MTVNKAGLYTTTILTAGAVAAGVVAATTTAGTAAVVAYGALSIGLGGMTGVSISAWINTKSAHVSEYFSQMAKHVGSAVAGLFLAISKLLLQIALVAGAAMAAIALL